MDYLNNIRYINDDFARIFLKQLMPGVIHNFANPLNSIMGRTKMMERRVGDLANFLQEHHPQVAADIDAAIKKLDADTASLSDNANYFRSIFKVLTDKLYCLTDNGNANVNLSHLMKLESEFGNFLLDFKHNVKKTLILDDDIPPVPGNQSHLSICLTMMIIHALNMMDGFQEKELIMMTSRDDFRAYLTIRYKGNVPDANSTEDRKTCKINSTLETFPKQHEQKLLLALSLLEEYGAAHEVTENGGWSEIKISLPCSGEMR